MGSEVRVPREALERLLGESSDICRFCGAIRFSLGPDNMVGPPEPHHPGCPYAEVEAALRAAPAPAAAGAESECRADWQNECNWEGCPILGWTEPRSGAVPCPLAALSAGAGAPAEGEGGAG